MRMTGGVARPQTAITWNEGNDPDTLDTSNAVYSAQYSYSGDVGGIYPSKGWLQWTHVHGANPTNANPLGMELAIIPGFGDSGTMPAGLSADGGVPGGGLTYAELVHVAVLGANEIVPSGTVVKNIWLGDGNLLGIGQSIISGTWQSAGAWDRKIHLEHPLPRFWSIYLSNSTGTTTGTGNSLTFQPVFDHSVI